MIRLQAVRCNILRQILRSADADLLRREGCFDLQEPDDRVPGDIAERQRVAVRSFQPRGQGPPAKNIVAVCPFMAAAYGQTLYVLQRISPFFLVEEAVRGEIDAGLRGQAAPGKQGKRREQEAKQQQDGQNAPALLFPAELHRAHGRFRPVLPEQGIDVVPGRLAVTDLFVPEDGYFVAQRMAYGSNQNQNQVPVGHLFSKV